MASLALGALLAMALPFPAAAQVPTPTPSFGQLEISFTDASELPVSVDQDGTRTFSVRYAAPNELPQHPQFARDVYLTVTAPQGWSATVTPSTLRLLPRESALGTLRVMVAAEGGTDASIHVQATSPSRSGTAADPGLQASATLEARRADTVTRQVLDTVGPGVYILLAIAPIAIVLGLIALARRPGPGVALQAVGRTATVSPGTRATFDLTIRNLARRPQPVRLHVDDATKGWAAILTEPEVVVPGGAVHKTQVVVVAPKDVATGDAVQFTVTAEAANDPRHVSRVQLEAVVSPAGKPRGSKA